MEVNLEATVTTNSIKSNNIDVDSEEDTDNATYPNSSNEPFHSMLGSILQDFPPARSNSINFDLNVIATAFKEEFIPGNHYDSKAGLLEKAQELANKFGFQMRLDSRKIMCTRSGTTRKTKRTDQEGTSNKRTRKSMNILKCGCEFYMSFGYAIPSVQIEFNGEIKTERTDRYRTTNELKQVKLLVSQSFLHTNGCRPSYLQLVMQQRKSGTPAPKITNMNESKLALATRIHLGKASSPPTQEKINKIVLKLLETTINCNATCAGIAVDPIGKIPDYDLVSAVKVAVARAIEETSCTKHNIIHVIPVTPWGNFLPALNALIGWCASSHGANEILFLSAETDLTSDAIRTLQSHLVKEDTLVVGVALPGHEYKLGENALTGVTCPWNTAAIWNVPKLALTGFPLVSDGLHSSRDDDGSTISPGPSGVEEVSAIALLQHILSARLAKAKLIRSDEIEWETNWDDAERENWHNKKMASKLLRPQRHLELLGLSGVVIHC